MTRFEALNHFAVAYLRKHGLCIPVKAVKDIIENKLIETNRAYYLEGTNWKLNKGE